MSAGGLSPLQLRLLRALAGLVPRWTSSGGGALAGVHTQHRDTRDLDLFFQAQRAFHDEPENAKRRLEASGFEVATLQRVEAFCRLEVRAGDEMTIVDLVADPVPLAEAPVETDLEGARGLVDTPHQVLVNKLCAPPSADRSFATSRTSAPCSRRGRISDARSQMRPRRMAGSPRSRYNDRGRHRRLRDRRALAQHARRHQDHPRHPHRALEGHPRALSEGPALHDSSALLVRPAHVASGRHARIL